MSGWLDDRPAARRNGLAGWARIVVRGAALAALTYGGLALLLLMRLVERPLFGQARPWTPHVTRAVCRGALAILGLRLIQRGRPMARPGAMVANHVSWLDIFALNACATVYFVAKSEVSGWAGIGWLARATGTVFIRRQGSEAKAQQRLFEERLRAGHRLLFFPEGTSTDGLRVLPFKSTLFAAFFTHGLEHAMHVQPVTLIYRPAEGLDPRHYGWWGDMDFAGHLLTVLATPGAGSVEVVWHAEVPVDGFEDRKRLASHCERVVRTSLPPPSFIPGAREGS
jgi:1-acyl-sn-glycerol-3-phosphate acyltransferase